MATARGRRDARLERLRRAGLPASLADAFVEPDTGISPPVTLAQTQARAALLAVADDFGGRLQGTILKTGDAVFSTELSITDSDITLVVISDSVTEIDETVPIQHDGLATKTYVVSVDPFEPIDISMDPEAPDPKLVIGARVYVDGKLLIAARGTTQIDPEDAGSSVNAWASSTADWEYGQVTNVSEVRDLEVHLQPAGDV